MTTTTAKKPAAKAAPTAPVRKLKWQIDGERKAKEAVPCGASVDGYEYRINREGEKGWAATVTHNGTTTVLSDSTFGAAYAACVKHNRAR